MLTRLALKFQFHLDVDSLNRSITGVQKLKYDKFWCVPSLTGCDNYVMTNKDFGTRYSGFGIKVKSNQYGR